MLIEGGIAVATGSRMFGEFFAERGRVAIFFAEDERQSVRNRVRSLLAGAGRALEPGQLYLESRGAFLDVLSDEDIAWVVASCRQRGPFDLLVLDPLRDIHSGEEDKSDSMRDVMRRLRVLGKLLGCTVWVSHHTPKTKSLTKPQMMARALELIEHADLSTLEQFIADMKTSAVVDLLGDRVDRCEIAQLLISEPERLAEIMKAVRS